MTRCRFFDLFVAMSNHIVCDSSLSFSLHKANMHAGHMTQLCDDPFANLVPLFSLYLGRYRRHDQVTKDTTLRSLDAAWDYYYSLPYPTPKPNQNRMPSSPSISTPSFSASAIHPSNLYYPNLPYHSHPVITSHYTISPPEPLTPPLMTLQPCFCSERNRPFSPASVHGATCTLYPTAFFFGFPP